MSNVVCLHRYDMEAGRAPEPRPAPRDVRVPGQQGYCPWQHLSHLDGVTLTWHEGGVRAFTTFDNMTISLRRGQSPQQLRSSLAHELVHIERGPGYGLENSVRSRVEERLVDTTAVLRLIPAGTLEDLPELVATYGREAAMAFLYIDKSHLDLALRTVEEMRR